jgi:hypothetical protein
MADRELVQLQGEAVLFDKIAGLDIDIEERGPHVGKVQLALTIGMGADAAIGDDHGSAI